MRRGSLFESWQSDFCKIYKQDHHGNVVALLSGPGVVEKYKYDAFGKPTVMNAAGTELSGTSYGNRFMFQGREWSELGSRDIDGRAERPSERARTSQYLSELGLYDYRHRVYHPGLGRFLQVDPTGFDAGDMNLFRYCGDDPVDRSDPTGLETLTRPEIDQQVGDRVVEVSRFVGNHFHPVLDIIGTIDPTPITDLFHAGIYAAKGDRSNALIGVVAAIPYIGDTAKLGKYGIKATSKIDRAAFKLEREAFWKAEAKNNPTKYSAEDLGRMEKGRAPLGPDRHPMELHHKDRTPEGGVEPMSRTDHRLGENYKKNHPDPDPEPATIPKSK